MQCQLRNIRIASNNISLYMEQTNDLSISYILVRIGCTVPYWHTPRYSTITMHVTAQFFNAGIQRQNHVAVQYCIIPIHNIPVRYTNTSIGTTLTLETKLTALQNWRFFPLTNSTNRTFESTCNYTSVHIGT